MLFRSVDDNLLFTEKLHDVICGNGDGGMGARGEDAERAKSSMESDAAKVTKENEDEDMEMVTMDGLLRLEEHKAMLLRTGVYTSEDHVVIKLQEQIKKMRRRIEAERDK